ncbi:motile sperm protein [Anaeramoeba flamelloides]|uniref:Motile sperm protein n=1 Tax=Anaeramoeba flamelloides TaxID=1746091 RepID=A0ABQ8YZW1_9EUKA|nr:motile sperm protein [Anaeramoeba flamelloides]
MSFSKTPPYFPLITTERYNESDQIEKVREVVLCKRPLKSHQMLSFFSNDVNHLCIFVVLENGGCWFMEANRDPKYKDSEGNHLVKIIMLRIDDQNFTTKNLKNYFSDQTIIQTTKNINFGEVLGVIKRNWYQEHEGKCVPVTYNKWSKNCQHFVDDVLYVLTKQKQKGTSFLHESESGIGHALRNGGIAFTQGVREIETTVTTTWSFGGEILSKTTQHIPKKVEWGFAKDLTKVEIGKFNVGIGILTTGSFMAIDGYRLAKGDIDGKEFTKRTGKNITAAGSGSIGAIIGGGIGTMICPGIGTAFGSMIGSSFASWGGVKLFNTIW